MPEAGTVIGGRYRLVSRIGEGATAAIWEAEHLTLGRTIAVKFLHNIGPPKGEAAQRFVREARVCAAIKHRNVVDILDFGLTDDDHRPYMVMERLDGRTLADYLHAVGPLSVAEAARLVSLILRGLSAVHDAGMVHRDLKPENIFLVDDEDGPFPKLLDFGLSRRVGRGEMTQEGMLLGTPDYMSPEQAMGSRNLDARTDIYAMGVILYELVTTRMPFSGETLAELLANVVDEPAVPLASVRPDLPEALVEIVERAMAKDKAERFTNAREMRSALAAADLGMTLSPESGLITLSERPPPPKGAFGGEPSSGRRVSRSSGKLPAVGRRTGAEPTDPEAVLPGPDAVAEAATQIDVQLPDEAAPRSSPSSTVERPAGSGSIDVLARVVTDEALARTLPVGAPLTPVPAPKGVSREPTGRTREDSAGAFVVSEQADEKKKPAGGSVLRTLFLFVVLLGAAAALAWTFYREALGLDALLASVGVPVEPAVPDAGDLVVAAGDLDAGAAPLDARDSGPEAADVPIEASTADAEVSDAASDDASADGGDVGTPDDAGEAAPDAGEEEAPRARGRRRPRRHRGR